MVDGERGNGVISCNQRNSHADSGEIVGGVGPSTDLLSPRDESPGESKLCHQVDHQVDDGLELPLIHVPSTHYPDYDQLLVAR